MTLIALNELCNLGIEINSLANDFPFWDTKRFWPKKEIFCINPSLAHNSAILDDLTL